MSQEILNQIKKISQTYDLKPSRSKGQNFLINAGVIEIMATASRIGSGQTVLEVGPGLGILTEELIKRAKKVISVELDRKLYDFLKVKFSGATNLELINEDILKFPTERLPAGGGYQIVANIPYNITSVFIKKFLTALNKPQSLTLLIQKEVAQRICAKPGQMSLLAVSVQLYARPEIVEFVGKADFWPKPEVDSAIIRIDEVKDDLEVSKFLGKISEKSFWQLVRIGFSAKRKQLQHNLSAGLKISQDQAKECLVRAGLAPQIRAQNLSVDDWLKLGVALGDYLK